MYVCLRLRGWLRVRVRGRKGACVCVRACARWSFACFSRAVGGSVPKADNVGLLFF